MIIDIKALTINSRTDKAVLRKKDQIFNLSSLRRVNIKSKHERSRVHDMLSEFAFWATNSSKSRWNFTKATLPLINLFLPQHVVVDYGEKSCTRQTKVYNIFDANVFLPQDDVNQLVRQDHYCGHREKSNIKELVICIERICRRLSCGYQSSQGAAGFYLNCLYTVHVFLFIIYMTLLHCHTVTVTLLVSRQISQCSVYTVAQLSYMRTKLYCTCAS